MHPVNRLGVFCPPWHRRPACGLIDCDLISKEHRRDACATVTWFLPYNPPMADDPDTSFLDDEGHAPASDPPPWGTESRAARMTRLHAEARALHALPGVYLMKDHKGLVIYVGKATKLCDRVGSYFLPSTDLGQRKNKLLDEVHCFDTFTTETAWEALLAENRLIKDIHPRHNAAQKDDRTFPYLVITMREDYPRVFVTRNPTGIKADGSKDPRFSNASILGPFTSSGALHTAVDALQAVFKFRTCSLDIIEGDKNNKFFRPCLLAAIGKCTAPCNESISKDVYREDIHRLTRFFKSKRSTMLKELVIEMQEASEASLDFETRRDAARSDQGDPKTRRTSVPI